MQVYGQRLNGRPLPLGYFLANEVSTQPTEEQGPIVVNPESTRMHGLSFFQAAQQNNFHITCAFLLAGVDPDARETEGGRGATAMHYAAASGEIAIVQLLKDNGANINSSTPNGQTPLMWAVEKGFADLSKHMVKLGADINAVDEEGHGIAFYGAFSPLTLHTFVKSGELDLSKAVNRRNQTPLHHIAQKPGTRIPALYFAEMSDIDINAADNRGGTALHYACGTGDINTVKALVSRGARWDIADGNGFTAHNANTTTRQCRAWIDKYAAETNNTLKERMSLPDVSNWAALDFEQIKHAAVPFFVPNLMVVLGTYFLPTILAMIVGAGAGAGFAMVAQFAMGQKGRSLATAGWFGGALVFGSLIVIHSVLPVYEKTHEDSNIPIIWMVCSVLMFYSYLRAVMADPGAVHGSPEERKQIYDSVAVAGESEVQRVGYDTTTMVTKPLRAKHCTKTHFTVYRFDHYCVWTGNAIGGGNHRFFVLYAFFQVIAQACVLTMTISYLFYAAPSLAKEAPKFNNLCAINNWFFNAENTIVTVFLLFYNSFVFLFVASVCFTQLWYASRNVTSNECWFADRYKWMFKLGSRAYCLYDQGFLKNLIGFFWRDNLCLDQHTVPAMNDHLIKVCRKYTAKMKSAQQSGPQAPAGGMDGSAHGHSHGGGGDIGSANVSYPDNPSGSPMVPQDFNLDHAVKQLPEDKQNEMLLVQGMLQQLIAGQDPTPPTEVSKERQDTMMHKAQTMYTHYKKALQMQNQMKASSSGAAPAEPAAHHEGGGGGAGATPKKGE